MFDIKISGPYDLKTSILSGAITMGKRGLISRLISAATTHSIYGGGGGGTGPKREKTKLNSRDGKDSDSKPEERKHPSNDTADTKRDTEEKKD